MRFHHVECRADKVGSILLLFSIRIWKSCIGSFRFECIVVAQIKKVSKDGEEPRWEIFTHGGRKPTGINAVEWAVRMAEYGAGEILLTSMDGDGTKKGYDLGVTRAISDAVAVPVIASGGVGNLQHLVDGVTLGRADAVLRKVFLTSVNTQYRKQKNLCERKN